MPGTDSTFLFADLGEIRAWKKEKDIANSNKIFFRRKSG